MDLLWLFLLFKLSVPIGKKIQKQRGWGYRIRGNIKNKTILLQQIDKICL